MARITVKDVRKAIAGMADDDPVALDMADPPVGYGYGIDGIANYGGTLQISVSEKDDEDDEDEVEIPGGVMRWDADDGTIRYIDDHGNAEGVWRPGDEGYTQKKNEYFADRFIPEVDDEEAT